MSFRCWKFIYCIKNKTLSGHPHLCRCLIVSAWTQAGIYTNRTDARPRPRQSTDIRADACGCPHSPADALQCPCQPTDAGPCWSRLYNPHLWGHFLLFLFCLSIGDLSFALAMPIPTYKGKGVASILMEIPCIFAKQKSNGCIYPWSACVFNSASYFCEDFGALPKKKSKTVFGNLQI